jgi:hypothetical protein
MEIGLNMMVSMFSVKCLPYFIDMYHVAYVDLYLLQDHFPKQAHHMSEQPDIHVTVAEPEPEEGT